MLRPVNENDAADIVRIYEPYVTNSHVSFELVAPTETEMRHRIREYTNLFPWYVWEDQKKVVGYAYASTYRTRAAYQWNAEVSVYVDSFRNEKTRLHKPLCRHCLT
jgi:L-amino acid N-acyltransferase YncA